MPDTEDNMDVTNGIKSQGNISCLRDLSESGDDLLHLNGLLAVTAGRAEEYCSTQVPSHPADVTICHTGNCCLGTEDPGPGQSPADVQVCKKTGLDSPLIVNSLLGEQADTPIGNPTYFVKDDSANSATVLEMYTEEVPSVSDDFSDDDLEYFECSDVLTVHEDEIWKKKLQFLLESDDEDDLKLSKDCDGCAYFLSEMPCVFQVSDNSTPMDTPIGFCGHHSKFKGVNVRRDPSMYSQSTLQTEMTLAVGHHRDKSTSLKDKDKSKVPVASAATGNEHPGSEEETDGSGDLAAGFSADKARHTDPVPAEADSSASGTGAAWTHQAPGTMTEGGTERVAPGESSLLLEEGGRNVPEENARHTICTLTESLRRNLFKLLNPLELCRYVSTIGQSFQAAAEGRESSAPSPSQEGVLSTQIPRETESLQMQAGLCQTEEADKDCHWERRRTRGLSEQNQMPDENISLGNQGANLRSVTQNCENLCMEPKTEGIFRACESVGTSQPAAEMLSTENTLQAKDADLQTSSLHCTPCDKREGCHQEVFSGQEIISNGSKSKKDISTFPLWGTDSLPDKQDCLCAVLSSAKLCDEPREGEQRSGFDIHDSSDPNILCSLSGDELAFEANPQPVLESGEPGCKGDADISAVHDKLWKLLHDDDSDCQIPFANRGITSLEMSPTDIEVTELNLVQETCSDHPLPMDVMEEQEPLTEPAHNLSTGRADCSVSGPLLQRAGACQGAPTANVCLARVVGTDGVCVDCSAGNETEAPSVCASANSIPFRPGERSEPSPAVTDSSGSTVAWEGKLPVNNDSQTCEADSPLRLQNAQGGNLACPEANPADVSDTSYGTAGQSLHPEHSISRINESVPGEGCRFRDCYPARGGLAYFPEEKDIFPSENTCQLTRSEQSSVNTIHESYEVNLQEEGNHSDSNAQNNTNSDSCHLSKINGCQDFQVVSTAQKYGSVMQLPTLLKTPETITHKNLPQNTDQLTEIAKQEGAFTPSSKDPLLSDFYLEVPSCGPGKPGGEQREIYTADEHRAETCCDSGVSQVSESQSAASPHYIAEQLVFLVDSTVESNEEFKTDSSKSPTCASRSVTSASSLLPRRAQHEHHSTAGKDQGMGDGLDSQQPTGTETLLFLTPVSHSQGLLLSSSAAACPGIGSQVKTGSTPTGVTGNRNLSMLETSCKASQGLCQRGPGETKGEAALCENEPQSPRAIEHNPDEAETKAPLHTLISSQAQTQIMNTSTEQSCPDVIPSSKVTEADFSIKSTKHDKEEEVRTAESVVSGLVNLPPVDSGSSRCFQEQTPCSRTQPFSLAPATRDPLPINVERQRNQEGSKSCQTPPAAAEPEPTKCKQDTAKCGHLAAGAKKKLPSAALSKKPRLEEKGSVSKDPSCIKKSGKSEAGVIRKEDRKSEQRRLILKKDSKAPRLLKKIQAESFPECSGNVKLCCQFGDIHGDSTITWTKDSKILARLQRSAQDDSPVSLEIAKASNKDQGMYYCCLNNVYGKVTAEFHLTAAVLERLSSFQSYEGVEEIEFMQLLFREDSIGDSYFGGNLHGVLATEELHFGEGMHRRAFRSRVRQGLAPVFAPGHPCVLKVHSALTCGTGTREELVQKNYNLALQECCVQNAAREYAKLYAAEAETLEGFGEVPEIIPIFLIHRPANNIPYATVEEELVGEFVKYSVRDGKEVNFLRRDSEAGQKCCTFQHWVYEKTSGNLLVTDLQGVGMKLTDVGIATLAKGYKGFKGNCSFSFIEQFRALHQCNEYCEMLGLKSLRTTHQKQRKATSTKSKNLPNSSAVKKMVPKKAREH